MSTTTETTKRGRHVSDAPPNDWQEYLERHCEAEGPVLCDFQRGFAKHRAEARR